jgi:thiol-disulfide isomerase/thioredoxin
MDLSGHERDKLFLSRGAKDVVDLSYLSGADGLEDARAFAKADLDRDGFEDLIVVNRNAPILRVYHNQLGPATKHHFIGLRVEGARQHDAVGARLTATGCGMTQTREIAIGTGFATVDAMAVTLGLGDCTKLDEVTVKFPGGERRSFKGVAADRFYRIVEGKGIAPLAGLYDRTAPPTAKPAATAPVGNPLLRKLAAAAPGHAPLVLLDLFATWCEACVRTAPRLDALTSEFADQIDAETVTIEPTDDAAALAKYRGAHPTTRPMIAYDDALTAEIASLFGGTPPLPSMLLVDRTTGSVVLQTRGLPTRSDLERAVFIRR